MVNRTQSRLKPTKEIAAGDAMRAERARFESLMITPEPILAAIDVRVYEKIVESALSGSEMHVSLVEKLARLCAALGAEPLAVSERLRGRFQ